MSDHAPTGSTSPGSSNPKAVRARAGRRSGVRFSGEVKVDFCRSMQGENWRELADLFEIRRGDQELFTRGDEVRSLWDLVESRGNLDLLPIHLTRLGHHHLAALFEEPAESTYRPPLRPPAQRDDSTMPRSGSGPAPSARRSLLIVEDNDSLWRILRLRLSPEFDCTIVTNFDEWEQLTRNGPPVFDGALVDRHLEKDMSDGLGLHVLEYLHRYTETRTVLMTVEPPAGFESDTIERFGVVGVYSKGEGNAGINIEKMIERLFGSTR